jgi:hypothetical protein
MAIVLSGTVHVAHCGWQAGQIGRLNQSVLKAKLDFGQLKWIGDSNEHTFGMWQSL